MIAPLRNPDPEDTDAHLMMSIKNGELAKFEELVQRNRSTVARFIHHFQAPGVVDREDLSQQVFFRVYKSRHTYEPTAKFSSWLYTITRNVVSNANRQLARRREVALQGMPSSNAVTQVEIAAEADPIREMIRSESRLAVQKAMMRLGERQRTALRLVHFSGYSYMAAANELMLTEMALKSLVQRARTGLKRLLKQEHGEGIDDMLKACQAEPKTTFTVRRT
ncbi:MAG: sigma-70 family RNA polymerase sigma factor [Planctomycetales bacterium]|nr:sigma-70 family RNA polymerase sigma factor [Planctomycetales bacterium]